MKSLLRGHNRSRYTTFLLLLMLVPAEALLAQSKVVEEIVVTATKRGAESAQDLPMSITALGQETLEAMGAQEFTDFSRTVAGLDVVDVGPGQKSYLVRGLNLPGESTVGLYYDNISMSGIGADPGNYNANQADLDLFDIERVEVLRGPQGTLYGANSVSGVVRVITNKPNADKFDGKVSAGGAYKTDGDEDWNVKGMVNVPLIDGSLALRAVGYIAETGGYIDNMQLNKAPSCYGVQAPNPEIVLLDIPGCNDGTSNMEDINSHRREGGRLSLQWNATEDTTVLLQGFYQTIDSEGRNAAHPLGAVNVTSATPTAAQLAARGGSPFILTAATGERQTNVLSLEPYEEELWIAAIELEHDFDWATGTLAASRLEREATTRLDSSNPARLHRTFAVSSTGPFTPGGFGPGMAMRGAVISPVDRVSLMQELGTEVTNFEARLASSFEGMFNFLVGFFYQENTRDINSEGRISDPATGADMSQAAIVARFSAQDLINLNSINTNNEWPTNPFLTTHRGAENTTETTAFYGEVYIDATDQVELMGGLRYFDTSREQTSRIIVPFLNSIFVQGASPGPEPNTPSQEDDFLFKGQVTYKPTEDHQVYFQIAEGYRASGVNAQLVSTIPPDYESDQTTNLEIGAKTTWLDGRLIANLSVYQVTWQNVQFEVDYTQQFNGLVNCTNADDPVEAKGFELGLQALATDNLDLGFNYTVMDAEWQVDANDCLTPAQLAATFTGAAEQKKGDTLVGVPDFSGSAFAQYNFPSAPFGGSNAFIRADIIFQGEVPRNDTDIRFNLANPSYVLTNINAGIDFGKYSIALFIRNVTDEEAHLSLIQGVQSNNRVTPSTPRTFGVNFSYNFGE